jgi:hypothetical protein
MSDWSERTIASMAQQSDRVVQGFTVVCGIYGVVSAFFGGMMLGVMLWCLCVFTFAPIHYLCREVLHLRRKIEDLEHRLG